MMLVSHNHRFLRAVVAIVAGGWFASAAGAATDIYGGPTYDSTTQTGYLYYPPLPVAPGRTAGDGVAVGHATRTCRVSTRAYRAVRWDASGTAATELGNLGTDSSGYTNSRAYAVNTAGTAVGYAAKYVSGIDKGYRAVRWDASGTAATELGNLGTNSGGVTSSHAYAINAAGTAVGYAAKYDVRHLHGHSRRALGRFGHGRHRAGEPRHRQQRRHGQLAYAINAAGTAVGYASSTCRAAARATRAVRWDASGTAATELGNLGTDSSGHATSYAYAVNTAGTARGDCRQVRRGRLHGRSRRALGRLGHRRHRAGEPRHRQQRRHVQPRLRHQHRRHGGGICCRSTSAGSDKAGIAPCAGTPRARPPPSWGTSAPTAAASRTAVANAINTAGIAVGSAAEYDSNGTFLGNRAVAWGLDGVAIDLNTLLDPGSGWVNLSEARGISDTNWVTGSARSTPATGSRRTTGCSCSTSAPPSPSRRACRSSPWPCRRCYAGASA